MCSTLPLIYATFTFFFAFILFLFFLSLLRRLYAWQTLSVLQSFQRFDIYFFRFGVYFGSSEIKSVPLAPLAQSCLETLLEFKDDDFNDPCLFQEVFFFFFLLKIVSHFILASNWQWKFNWNRVTSSKTKQNVCARRWYDFFCKFFKIWLFCRASIGSRKTCYCFIAVKTMAVQFKRTAINSYAWSFIYWSLLLKMFFLLIPFV